jgi:dolichyl-phosphate-mannose--protein O-mannosyl transferase
MDGFLLAFGFASLLFYAGYRNRPSVPKLILTGIFGGLAISIKWTGASFLAIPVLMEIIPALRHLDYGKILKIAVFLGAVPLLIYFSFFIIHFEILANTGEGANFHTPEFQKTLIGNDYQNDASVEPMGMIKKFTELNVEMYTANQRLDATHPYSSQWYTWPFMSRSIYYWNGSGGDAKIYFLGNPVVWWVSSVAMMSFLSFLLFWQIRPDKTNLILLAGYAINILPFVGVKRVMFLYHYLTALVFAVIILVYLIDRYESKRRLIFGIIVISALAAFIYFAPLSYGLPIGEEKLNSRLWFESWE